MNWTIVSSIYICWFVVKNIGYAIQNRKETEYAEKYSMYGYEVALFALAIGLLCFSV